MFRVWSLGVWGQALGLRVALGLVLCNVDPALVLGGSRVYVRAQHFTSLSKDSRAMNTVRSKEHLLVS